MPPLECLAVFEAQSVVLGKYLSREGYDFIGAMVDAQILGGSVDAVLTKRTGRTLEQTDADLRQWVIERADLLHR